MPPSPSFRVQALAAACLMLGLSACASPPAVPASKVRVLVEFQSAVDGGSPEWLDRLARLTGTPVRHVSSASPRLHAYELACPEDDSGCARAIDRLRADAAVAGVSADRLRSPHQ